MHWQRRQFVWPLSLHSSDLMKECSQRYTLSYYMSGNDLLLIFTTFCRFKSPSSLSMTKWLRLWLKGKRHEINFFFSLYSSLHIGLDLDKFRKYFLIFFVLLAVPSKGKTFKFVLIIKIKVWLSISYKQQSFLVWKPWSTVQF